MVVSAKRLADLEFVADLWQKGRERSEKEFAALVELRKSARLTSSDDIEFLDARIEAADFAIHEYLRAHTYANSLVDRAKAGEEI
jgi:hypothetical protein